MKVAIYGAGAIGAHLGGMLARDAGDGPAADVSLIARGPHLAAMQSNGLTLRFQDGEAFTVRPNAVADPAELGPQDYVSTAVTHAYTSFYTPKHRDRQHYGRVLRRLMIYSNKRFRSICKQRVCARKTLI